MLLRSSSPEALRAHLLSLREGLRRKTVLLEAKHRRRRFPLEKARQEFQRNLAHLQALLEEGRFPAPLLERAILREELRLRHLEEELRRIEEAHRHRVAVLWAGARARAARRMAKSGLTLDLDALFPEVKDEPSGEP